MAYPTQPSLPLEKRESFRLERSDHVTAVILRYRMARMLQPTQ